MRLLFCTVLAAATMGLQGCSDGENLHNESVSRPNDGPSGAEAAFLKLPGDACGAVKIAATRPLYLSALHCFESVPAVQDKRADSLQLGDLGNYDWVVSYNDLTDVSLGDGRTIRAAGGAWTGYALDVLKNETAEHVALAAAALTKDWVIVEDPGAANAASGACVPVRETFAPATAVTALGLTKEEPRTLALSPGQVMGDDFRSDARYKFADQWSDTSWSALAPRLDDGALLVSDADVWPGMSGGPVIDAEGNLLAVSTVKLEPNFCPLSEDECAAPHFATHGAVTVRAVQQGAPAAASVFDCP